MRARTRTYTVRTRARIPITITAAATKCKVRPASTAAEDPPPQRSGARARWPSVRRVSSDRQRTDQRRRRQFTRCPRRRRSSVGSVYAATLSFRVPRVRAACPFGIFFFPFSPCCGARPVLFSTWIDYRRAPRFRWPCYALSVKTKKNLQGRKKKNKFAMNNGVRRRCRSTAALVYPCRVEGWLNVFGESLLRWRGGVFLETRLFRATNKTRGRYGETIRWWLVRGIDGWIARPPSTGFLKIWLILL